MPLARRTALAVLLLAMPALPAWAEPAETLPERMERALREMMQGLEPELEDALDWMRSFGTIGDPRHYELPEILPNGDIIIRRRDDAPPVSPDAPEQMPEGPDDPAAPPAANPDLDPEDGVRI